MARTQDRGATRTETTRANGTPFPRDVLARPREEHGGINWGSAFFGWLVAIGVAALLTAILSAAGAAIGLTQASASDASSNAGTVGIVSGIVLLAILGLAYYAGGYVAGRMSRFDGPRQGLAAWLIGLIVTVVLAVAGVLLGAEYNVLSQLNLPRVPVDEGSLTTGGLIALVAIVLVTLLAAIAGGKQGTHYHRKIDRTGGIER
jgi:MFS family permease